MRASSTLGIGSTSLARLVASLALGLAASQAGLAQQSEQDGGVSIEVSECLELESEIERFGCYEALVEEARDEPNARSAEGSPARAESRPTEEPNPASAAQRSSRTPVEPAKAARAASTAASASSPTEVAVRPVNADAAGQPDERFGLRDLSDQAGEEEAPELVSTIAALRERVPNSYLITLENGQIWRQTRPRRYPLRVGYEVRIYPAGWGKSYRLTSDVLNGFIQVERVR